MKIIFMLAACFLAWPMLSSCSDSNSYGNSQGYHSSSLAYSRGFNHSGYGRSGSYSALQVGFIGTNFDRWSYDPYRRSYYDRSLKRYYNHTSRSYYTSTPRRYSSPLYPSGYRKGGRISLPSHLASRSSSGFNNNRNTRVTHGTSSGSRRLSTSSQNKSRATSQYSASQRKYISQSSRRTPISSQTSRSFSNRSSTFRGGSSQSERQTGTSQSRPSTRSTQSFRQPSSSRTGTRSSGGTRSSSQNRTRGR